MAADATDAADADLDVLLSTQHRELMAASAAESDLDLAFRLQMEEAMVASLAVQPSSSSSAAAAASSSSSFVSPSVASTPIASSFSVLPSAVGSDDNGNLAFLLGLQAQELQRFHQEKKDGMQCQTELRHVADEVRRRAHDERFAREIEEMPDEDWEEFGDNFERPIGGGEEDAEPFRLYFKGMASREFLQGTWVQLAAIGAAVCDTQNNVLLKIQKPFPGVGTGRELLETKALIEGLNAASSLGIKRVHVFFDYKVLYNHVTGRWAVRQRKLANMVNQVLLLRSKFETCEMFLLPRCHMTFVFRLARETIDSQITKQGELNGTTSSKETCNICLEATDSCEMFTVDGCSHRFCISCMRQHVEVKLLHGMLPGCPHDGCNIRLKVENSVKFLTPKLSEIMAQRIKEESIPPEEAVYCPYPKCSFLMSLSEAICPEVVCHSRAPIVDLSGLRKCIKCTGLFCINCKVPWHDNMSCFDYKRLYPTPPEDAKLKSLARQKLWRQCVKCNRMIELAEGCYHMTCRCGYEFCYTCGKEWKDKKATCSCPLWDEGNILHDESEEDEDFFEDEDYYDNNNDDYYEDFDGGYRMNDDYFFNGRPHADNYNRRPY